MRNDIDKNLISTTQTPPPNPAGIRDSANAELMNAYAQHFDKKSAQNRSLKKCFFWIIMGLTFVIVAIFSTISIIIASNGVNGGQEVATIFATILSALTSIIVLPTIICKYLFPKGEDDQLLKYMTTMHKEDTQYKQFQETHCFNSSEEAQSFIANDSYDDLF